MRHDGDIIPDKEVFQKTPRITLADVLRQVEAHYSGTALRDARSAFRALQQKAAIDLTATVATPAILREIFAGPSPARLGVSAKRLANIRSILTRAVRRFGQPRTWVTKEIPLTPEWEDLLGKIPGGGQYRWGLSRLACYCSVKGISPDGVSVETLCGLFTALEAEAVSKDPRNLLKRTIASWNHCRKTVPGWPDIKLASPFKTDPYMLPLEVFPASFRRDIAAWEDRMSNPDPLDPKAPVRALRTETLMGYRYTFRRLASALIRNRVKSVEDLTGLDVFFELETFKDALRPFLPGDNIKTDAYAHRMATQMITIGRQHLGISEEDLEPFVVICDRLKPRGGRRMGERNRERLEQFDDENVVRLLLRFPEEELGRALEKSNSMRRAKGVERALAISLAIYTGLRVKNLRELRLDQNIRRSGRRVFVRIDAEEAKTYEPLEIELPAEPIRLLDLFVDDHRALLPGADGPYLFPGESGGPRSYSAMRDALGKPLWNRAGITLSPHLFRHIIAKIVVERQPELALDVSRRLGHKSIDTTYQSYLGTETPAACRRINALLGDVRDATEREGGE